MGAESVLLQRAEPVDGPLARRALVLIVFGDVDEVALVEATRSLGPDLTARISSPRRSFLFLSVTRFLAFLGL
jgi:hypothetical protein